MIYHSYFTGLNHYIPKLPWQFLTQKVTVTSQGAKQLTCPVRTVMGTTDPGGWAEESELSSDCWPDPDMVSQPSLHYPNDSWSSGAQSCGQLILPVSWGHPEQQLGSLRSAHDKSPMPHPQLVSGERSKESDQSNRTLQKDRPEKTKVKPSCWHRTRCGIFSLIGSFWFPLIFSIHCGLYFEQSSILKLSQKQRRHMWSLLKGLHIPIRQKAPLFKNWNRGAKKFILCSRRFPWAVACYRMWCRMYAEFQGGTCFLITMYNLSEARIWTIGLPCPQQMWKSLVTISMNRGECLQTVGQNAFLHFSFNWWDLLP